jgi:hypothetical protein
MSRVSVVFYWMPPGRFRITSPCLEHVRRERPRDRGMGGNGTGSRVMNIIDASYEDMGDDDVSNDGTADIGTDDVDVGSRAIENKRPRFLIRLRIVDR